ncbi:MAG TPA: Crp/Fnr family transcriptional regulator [Desulfobulbaceae bacterium]|nr:Crp/Fnr family transcriptional regulator [Desulfobulbaceae bacterium]
MKNKRDIIAGSFLFEGISSSQLTELSKISVVKTVRRGETVFFEGDDAVGFYMVVEGQVKIFKISLEGREQTLHIFGPGEPFGEVPVFHGRPFPAHAAALSKGKLLFFPRTEFIGLVHTNPSIALNMLAMLSMRLRRFTTQIEHLSLKEVPGRLASHLLYLCKEQKGADQVTLDIPKGQLASLLGTSPETLSRIFAKMREEGIIQVQGKVITLLDRERLQAF